MARCPRSIWKCLGAGQALVSTTCALVARGWRPRLSRLCHLCLHDFGGQGFSGGARAGSVASAPAPLSDGARGAAAARPALGPSGAGRRGAGRKWRAAGRDAAPAGPLTASVSQKNKEGGQRRPRSSHSVPTPAWAVRRFFSWRGVILTPPPPRCVSGLGVPRRAPRESRQSSRARPQNLFPPSPALILPAPELFLFCTGRMCG